MRKVFLSLLTFVIVFGFNPSAVAEDKESFFPPALQVDGKDRIFSVGGNLGFGFSQLGHWPDMLCKSTKDPKCDFTRIL